MKVVITDYGFPNIEREKTILARYQLEARKLHDEQELINATRDADAVMVQWAPITRAVIEKMERCKVIVRYGIGVDNVDLAAARDRNIAVCNVPDYCIEEVADHTVTLALTLHRQVMQTDKQVREGIWKITPPETVSACVDCNFVTVGFGRIARSVLKRAQAFGFKTFACDPFVESAAMDALNVTKVSSSEAVAMADILSLHLPLTPESYHFINKDTLSRMRKNSLIVNTARGGLIDLGALAWALREKQIGGAALDVFEKEPLEKQHPIRASVNTIITSHTAWYSERSIPLLQQLAAEEVLRALMGEPLTNRVA